MNIHFPQVERKSQLFSHLLIAFAAFTVLVLALSLSPHTAIRFSATSMYMPAAYTKNSDWPVAVPAPVSPATVQVLATATPQPAGDNMTVVSTHLPIRAPMPSVP
ncbi:MAG TPA: hypothetical protein VIS72_12335 [Anaerolineales bacterium]